MGSPEPSELIGGCRTRLHQIEVTMRGMRRPVSTVSLAILFASAACSESAEPRLPTQPRIVPATASSGVAWGPETPNFNLEVILRGEGFGHVKFRQPNDEENVVHLDVWVRDLAPNTSYLLQRAVDTTIDDNCTSSAWLTLGKGAVPQSIDTDDTGTGTADLFRNLGTTAAGTTFDIHFRVIDATTSAVVLESQCYQFTISL